MERLNERISRRALLRDGAVGISALAATALVGCGTSDDKKAAPTGAASPTPLAATQPAATPTRAASKPVWARLPSGPGPAARRDHSLTFNADDGLIYLFGGRAKGVADNQLWTFDPKAGSWRQVVADDRPEPRFAHDASYDAANKRLIVTLGQGNGGAFFNDVWAYADGRWTQLDGSSAEHPEIRYGAGGAHDKAGHRILISHGFTDRGRFDDTWAFDLSAGIWSKIATTGAAPIKRCLTRCLWQAGSLLMFGGQTDDNPFLGDFWALDVARGAWSERSAAPLPGPRNLYGASLDGGGKRWYIVGGNTAQGPTDEVWAHETAAGAWSRIDAAGEAPPRRYSTDAAYADGKLYIFGGHDGTSEIDDMWALATDAA